jgi:hypothetical protein
MKTKELEEKPTRLNHGMNHRQHPGQKRRRKSVNHKIVKKKIKKRNTTLTLMYTMKDVMDSTL